MATSVSLMTVSFVNGAAVTDKLVSSMPTGKDSIDNKNNVTSKESTTNAL